MRQRSPDVERRWRSRRARRASKAAAICSAHRSSGSAGCRQQPVKPAHRTAPRDRAPARLATKARLVFEAAQIEHERLSSMRPITGTGSRRSASRERVERTPRRARCAGGSQARRSARSSSGSAPEPIWLAQSTISTRERVAERLATSGSKRAPPCASISVCGRASSRSVGSRSRQPVGIAIELQRRFERREPDLVDPQRPLHRIAVDPRDQILAADDEARLRAAEQLVAGEGDEIGAFGDRLAHRRLVREAEAAQDRPACRSRDRGPAARRARARSPQARAPRLPR